MGLAHVSSGPLADQVGWRVALFHLVDISSLWVLLILVARVAAGLLRLLTPVVPLSIDLGVGAWVLQRGLTPVEGGAHIVFHILLARCLDHRV